MIKKITASLAAASLAFSALPAFAQDAEEEYVEEPRTTWELRFIDLTPGSEGAFLDQLNNYFNPAREKAGMKPVEVHFLHNGQYNLLMVMEMPGGMAMFDTHRNETGMAFQAALLEIAGSEEELEKIFEAGDKLVKDTRSIYSHTHP